jgi:hypothetical protein
MNDRVERCLLKIPRNYQTRSMKGLMRTVEMIDAVPWFTIMVALASVQVETTCGWRAGLWLPMKAIPCLGWKKMTDFLGVGEQQLLG